MSGVLPHPTPPRTRGSYVPTSRPARSRPLPYQLGIGEEATARQDLSGSYQRTGFPNAAQAAFTLGRAVEIGESGASVIQAATS
jgi:hypothetical protein